MSNKVSDFIADLKWTSMDGHLHLLLESFGAVCTKPAFTLNACIYIHLQCFKQPHLTKTCFVNTTLRGWTRG